MRYLLGLLSLVLLGCSSFRWEERSTPLFDPCWQIEEWIHKGASSRLYAFDYDGDGLLDLFLLAPKTIACFLANGRSWEKQPAFTIELSEDIVAFDITRCPAQKYAWLLLQTAHRVFLSQEPSTLRLLDFLPADATEEKMSLSSGPVRRSLFQDRNGDTLPDLLIPFCKNFLWHVAAYVYENGTFQSAGILDLKSAPSFLPPVLYSLSDNYGKEILLGDGLSIYTPYETQPSLASGPKRLPVPSDFSPQTCTLLGIADLNHGKALEILLWDAGKDKTALLTDLERVSLLSLPGMGNLAAYFEDVDHDLWEDILILRMGKPHPISLLGNVAFHSRMVIPLDLFLFRNREGQFSPIPDAQIRQNLYLRYPLPTANPHRFFSDADGDSRWDAYEVKDNGTIAFTYDVMALLTSQKSPSALQKFFSPLYPQFLALGLPSHEPDLLLELPPLPLQATLLDTLCLPLPGQHSRMLLLYRDKTNNQTLLRILLPFHEK